MPFTDGNVRVSQMPVEVLALPVPFARVSQMAVEALVLPVPFVRDSQLAVEVLTGPYPPTPPQWRPQVTFI